MTSFAREEREQDEREWEDNVRAGLACRTFEELHDLQLGYAETCEVCRRLAVQLAAARVMHELESEPPEQEPNP